MKLGLIAGLGDLPRLIVEHREARGEETFILGFHGFTEPWMEAYPHVFCGIGEAGKIMKGFKGAGCDTISMIGIVKRPDFATLKTDLKGVSLLPKILKAATRGDDALLRCAVEIFESEGLTVIGAHELMAELRPKAGILSKRKPDVRDKSDIEHCYMIAGETGRLDIGQGAIVADGLVLAVEAQEGTDAMLKRIAALPDAIRGTEAAPRGVLVKRPKPGQEKRVDLPVIGLSTLENAYKAGLSTVAFVEDGTLLVEEDKVTTFADAHEMSLVCLHTDGRLP